MEYDQQILFKYLIIYIFQAILILFINSSYNSKGNSLRLDFAFDGSGSVSSWASLLLDLRVIEL